MYVLGATQTNFELAQHFRSSKIAQARDRSTDPPRTRLEGWGGTDATGELCKAAARRPQEKATRRDQAGGWRGGGKNPFDEAFGHSPQARRARLRACFKSNSTTVCPHPEEA
jgi:hypothetical protein